MAAPAGELSAISVLGPELMATATLSVTTRGTGFVDITAHVRDFVARCGAGDGVNFQPAGLYVAPDFFRHAGKSRRRLFGVLQQFRALKVPV